ncbi:HpcH/HpaI aldolase/citrate lyase family protein [Zhengella sp. ZM62]|uniref:HpcH/HpaI aldolase/citrate lyase family protein n=1 Tax=Zhengella sedimenti TaxID=3390035 RepID=UPI003974790B
MTTISHRPRRAVLYVPASNEKALAKVTGLAADAVIFDLEDAVTPEGKEAAREALRRHFREHRSAPFERIIRINALSGEWGAEDLLAARGCRPDAILLPKVDGPGDLLDAADALAETDAPASMALWAMIETPRAVLNLPALADLALQPGARLGCFIAGTNDLVKDTGVAMTPDREYLRPWLQQMVLAARAGGIAVLDGVSNQFRDLDAFAAECAQGAAQGFDGKTLIHPAQIEPAKAAFSPSAAAVEEALAIRAAFAEPANAGKGVISMDGRMVERLHLEQAERLLARAGR